jgi:hypothetical protein
MLTMKNELVATRSALSEAQLAEYADDGLTVARLFLPRSAVEDLDTGWKILKDQIVQGTVPRANRFVNTTLPEPLGSIYRHPAIVEAIHAILGTTDVALYMHRMLLKDEEWSGSVAIHQDMPYFHGGLPKVSVFVPLTPTMARGGNGGLIFLKGSHRYGNLQRGTIRRDCFPNMEEMAPDLEVGDVVFMDFLTWHYSEDAVVPGERPLMQIVYQPATDGSYGSLQLGVPSPTLVSGSWLTKHFTAWNESTIPDVVV